MAMKPGLMILEIKKESVISCDTTGFDNTLVTLCATAGLESIHNNLAVSFLGYRDDPREIWDIPEARQYVLKLKRRWPYLFFFLDLDNDDLGQAQVFLPFFVSYKTLPAPSGRVSIELDMDSYNQFIRSEARTILEFCASKGMRDAEDKMQAIITRLDQAMSLS